MEIANCHNLLRQRVLLEIDGSNFKMCVLWPQSGDIMPPICNL